MSTRTPDIPDRFDLLRRMFAEILDLDADELPPPGSMPKRALKKPGKRARTIREAERHRILNHARYQKQNRKPNRDCKLPVPQQACRCCGRDFQPSQNYRLLCPRCRRGNGPARICPYNPWEGYIR